MKAGESNPNRKVHWYVAKLALRTAVNGDCVGSSPTVPAKLLWCTLAARGQTVNLKAVGSNPTATANFVSK